MIKYIETIYCEELHEHKVQQFSLQNEVLSENRSYNYENDILTITSKINFKKEIMKELKDSNFKKNVLKNTKTVLVDFYAPWCSPCKSLTPVLEEIDKDNDNVDIFKINIDEEIDYALKYGVRNVPTVLKFKNGELVDKQVGVAPRSVYEDLIK